MHPEVEKHTDQNRRYHGKHHHVQRDEPPELASEQTEKAPQSGARVLFGRVLLTVSVRVEQIIERMLFEKIFQFGCPLCLEYYYFSTVRRDCQGEAEKYCRYWGQSPIDSDLKQQQPHWLNKIYPPLISRLRKAYTLPTHLPPPIGRETARCKNFLPPKPTKTSPTTPPPYKAKQNFAHAVAGTWGKFPVREGGLEGRIPSFKRGLSPSKVFPITSSCSTCCSGRLWRALRRTCSPGACPGSPSSRADPSA